MPTITGANNPKDEAFHAGINLLSCGAAARLLGISGELLRVWRTRKIGPSYIKYPTGGVRYREDVLVAFVIEMEVTTRRLPKLYKGPLWGSHWRRPVTDTTPDCPANDHPPD